MSKFLGAKHWIYQLIYRRAAFFESLLICCSCLFIYLANGQLISSNDAIPNSLLAFNWLENQTLHFDIFRGGFHYGPDSTFGANGLPYFFVEAPNGHLTSAYPIGVAIVSFPLYLLFFIYLKFSLLVQSGADPAALALNLSDPSFDLQRRFFEKLAGATATALAAAIFYLASRLTFSRAVALLSTFIYAFATLNWVVSAQGLWQHTISNLVLISLIFCLLKANRSQGNQRQLLLIMAGVFCGLLPGIRLTSLLFSFAILIYSVVTYRREALFVLLGATSISLNAIWNVYYFGFSFKSLLVGGYSSLFKNQSSSYEFTFQYFKDAFLGLLISPSRGFFVFSPVLLFASPGVAQVFRRRSPSDERLLAYLTIACLALFIHYCFYIPWWGAVTYGSRFLSDTLPVLCYLLGYFLASRLEAGPPSPIQSSPAQRSPRIASAALAAFLTCLAFSTFTQVAGAFSDPGTWDSSQVVHPSRFWDWQDSQIERHARNLFSKIHPPIQAGKPYLRQLSGVIQQIKDAQGQPIANPLQVNPTEEMVLQADLQNTGQSRWYGDETGLRRGRTIVKIRFFNGDQEVKTTSSNLLYVTGSPQTGEAATATGSIRLPEQPGEYRVTFTLRAERLGSFPHQNQQPAYEIKAIVGAG